MPARHRLTVGQVSAIQTGLPGQRSRILGETSDPKMRQPLKDHAQSGGVKLRMRDAMPRQMNLAAAHRSNTGVMLLLVGNDRAVHLLPATTALEAVVLLERIEEAGARELARAAIAVDGEIVHERVRAAGG